MPKVSIIMSVYNGSEFLSRAIESILEQTEKDFEFIIINDGSTESVHEIINSFSDPRIRSYRDIKNRGLTVRLNEGLDLAKGDFIVRMDGDDISLPQRIERQLTKFESGVGFVGCWGRSIDANGLPIIHFVDTNCRCSDEDLKSIYPKTLCMIDASSIYSKEAIEKIGYFDPKVLTAETYNYNRRIQQFFDGRVIKEILYVRTVWQGSVMRSKVDPKIDTITLANQRAIEQPIIKELS